MAIRLHHSSQTYLRGCLLLLAVCCLADRLAADKGSEFFESRIRPVLVESCFECHSSKSPRIGGQLRLDSRESILRGGELGPAVVVGQPEESLLVRAIEHIEPDLKMPKRGNRLGNKKIADFKRWIRDGMVWPSQSVPSGANETSPKGFNLASRKERLAWIWELPQKQPLPSVENENWPLTEVDRFVLAEIEAAGVSPNPDASPALWLRRVSQVLLGLPPSLSLQDQFLSMRPEQAYSFAVDQMLGSPRFGERWARHWMDLVRYAESRGHESDYIIANAYHYRDYLIRALNADLPYDQFVIEQLAGDTLTSPRKSIQSDANESVLGTGWAFLGEEVHSPVDIRQDECDRLDNKVDVLSKTFLGLTVACARCHDHKFDAISQKDYYALAGFFLSSDFQQVRFESQLKNREIKDQLRSVRTRFDAKVWQRLLESIDLASLPESLSYPQSRSLGEKKNHRAIVQFTPKGLHGATLHGPGFTVVERGRWALSAIEGDRGGSIALYDSVRRDPHWNPLRLSAGNETDSGSLDAVSRANGMLKTHRFQIGSGRFRYLIKGKAKVYAAVDSHIMVAGPLHGSLVKQFDTQDSTAARWVTHDLSNYRGHLVHLEFGGVDDEPLEILAVVEEADDTTPDQPYKDISQESVSADQCRVAASQLKEKSYQIGELDPLDISALVALALHSTQGTSANSSELAAIFDQWAQAELQLMQGAQMDSLTAVALSDNNGINESVLIRGNPKRPGQIAQRSLPGAFDAPLSLPPQSSGRYELAKAIASPDNPLTGRVIVNRVWHHVFGRGIVPTVDNFGYLGERPSHPQLLDHLAYQFTHEDEWSLKRLLRKILLSRTYRTSSQIPLQENEQGDRSTRLYARFPVRRLEAEAIRDNVLAVSEALDTTMYGPSIPVHLTDFVIGRGRPSQSGPLDGLGRRSVYIAVRRNFLPTLMTAFDFPSPFSTMGKRNVTNVPAQALALANDAFMHDQAKRWAESLTRAVDRSEGDRIKEAFRRAFSRLPTPSEERLCLESLSQFRELHSEEGGELQAWGDLLHSLLSMNEFRYIR